MGRLTRLMVACTAAVVMGFTGCGGKPAADATPKAVLAGETKAEPSQFDRLVAEADARMKDLLDANAAGTGKAERRDVWDQDRQVREMFGKYVEAINVAPTPTAENRPTLARVFGRVIDLAATDMSNPPLAQEVAMKCLRQDIVPVVTLPKSGPILQAARKAIKQEEKELDDWLDKQPKP